MPFDAMKGLQEALRDREERHSRVERHDISDEQLAQNNRLLQRLSKGDKICLECHHAFHDIRLEGRVTEISFTLKYLKIMEEKVYFDDIYSVKIIDYV